MTAGTDRPAGFYGTLPITSELVVPGTMPAEPDSNTKSLNKFTSEV